MNSSTNNEMDQITDKIWLGNYKAANNVDDLKKEGIKKVLCILEYCFPEYREGDDLKQKIIKIEDKPTQNIIKYLGECLNFIKGDDKILVHCMAGSSRSGSIVIAYIMWAQKMSFDDALNLVVKKRAIVSPNFGFVAQLKIFEKLLLENHYDLNKIDFDNFKWEVILNEYLK